jgi:hypothetical protein
VAVAKERSGPGKGFTGGEMEVRAGVVVCYRKQVNCDLAT